MDEALMAHDVRIASADGVFVEGYLARPLFEQLLPGVVVLHHSPGWDQVTKDIVRRLAAVGYLALAPNLYARQSAGLDRDEAARAIRSRGGVPTALVQQDVAASDDLLRNDPQSNGKVGVVGYSFGGRQTFIAACTQSFDAAVMHYGGYIVSTIAELKDKHAGEEHDAVPLDLASGLSCPLLGLFGEQDVNPSAEHVAVMASRLSELNKKFEFHSYPETGHGFATWNLPHYKVDAAVDAWGRMVRFFDEHLAR